MLDRVSLFFNKLLDTIVVFCVFGMVIVIVLQVIFRFVFNDPLSWSEEISRYFFVWITFLGAAVCSREKGHIGMDFVVNMFPKNIQKKVELFGYIAMILVLVAIGLFSLQTVKLNLIQKSPALQLNMGVIYAAIPIGFFYMTVYYTKHLINCIQGKLVYSEQEGGI